MTDSSKSAPSRSRTEDKAERTTRAANEILDRERQASDAKVARLKALRLAGEAQAPAKPAAPARAPVAVRRKTAASLRKLALHDTPSAKAPPKRS